jgi:hypothetical protein
MKRLTLDELKAQKNQKNVVAQLEAIKGGLADSCHVKPKTWASELGEAIYKVLDSFHF